jgi:hypothetical protein
VGKKDLASVTADLSELASMMPTQRPPMLKAVQAPSQEDQIQFSLSMRKHLRKELARLAAEVDMTMRAFVLNALKDKGLSVREDDLAICARNGDRPTLGDT